MSVPKISMIVAYDKNRAIGLGNNMLWHIPEDFKHFKSTTMGYPIIMGRKTWDSLPKKPLPGRINVVLSRAPITDEEIPTGVWASLLPQDAVAKPDVMVNSITQALNYLEGQDKAFVIGGEEIYRLFMPIAQELIVTEVEAEHEADKYFPNIDLEKWEATNATEWRVSSKGYRYRIVWYHRMTY